MKQRAIIRVFKTLKNMLSKYRVDTRAGKIYNKKTKKEVANSFDIRGYRVLSLKRNGIWHAIRRSHMVFWAKNKYMPNVKRCIDHKNGIQTDDRASNLQDLSNAENSAKRTTCRHKFYGTSFYKTRKRYRARVIKLGKRFEKYCSTEQEAAMARDQLIVKHYWTEYHERGFLPPLNFPDRLPSYIQNVKNSQPRMVQMELNFA